MSNGNHRLVVYDNRYSSAYSYIDINSKYTSCTVNGEEKALSFNFITNFDTYDQIDIDGANNVYRAPAKSTARFNQRKNCLRASRLTLSVR